MSVAIVGAGIAGLQVARRLDAAGVPVQLFDKARGAGGRLSTRRTEAGPFDHGAQYFTVRDPRFRSVVEGWIESGVVARWSPTCVRIDAAGAISPASEAERYVGLPGMSGIARALRGALPIELGVRIQSLRRDEKRWVLVSDAGFDFGPFERVVVAVPAPQAIPLLHHVPLLRARARMAGMAPCHAVLASFSAPLPVSFDGAFVEGRALGWAARNAAKPGREGGECWVLHSTAAWSEAHVDAPADEVESVLLGDLRDATEIALPALRSVSMHRWLFARVARTSPGPQWDAASRVGVCGDWLLGERVEDAFLTGDLLADDVLGDLSG